MSRWLKLLLVLMIIMCVIFSNNAFSIDINNLVAYWSFNKGSGQTVADESGHGFEGKVMDSEWSNDGKNGGAMSFNGAGQFVQVASDPGLNPGTDNWTIELWLKRADSAGDWHKILTKYPGNWTGYRIGFLDSSIHAIFGLGPAPNSVEFQTTKKIIDQEWHHLALTVDRKSDAIIYIDGEADEKTASVKGFDGQEIAPQQDLEIGRCHWCGGGMTMGFNGLLDEIKIWREAFTEDDIKLAMDGKIKLAVSPKHSLVATWGILKKSI